MDKLISFLAVSLDDHFRSDLVNQITQCAERFAPSNTWYVQTIIRVFELAGDKVKHSVAQTLTQLIAEGAETDEDEEGDGSNKDDELRAEAVEHFLDLLDKPKLPAVLAQTMAWVLGEYGYLSMSCSKEGIMDKLCALAQTSQDPETKAHVITALGKLIAQAGTCPSRVLNVLNIYATSRSVEVQQRCLEVRSLLKHSETMVEVLPVDASCEDIEVDTSLSFLNGFVQAALQQGARPYNPPAEFLATLDEGDGNEKKSSLKITPYAVPKMPVSGGGAVGALTPAAGPAAISGIGSGANAGPTPLGPAINNQQAPPQSIATAQGNQLINTRGANAVWGKKAPPPPPVPTPAAAPPAASPVASHTAVVEDPVSNGHLNGQQQSPPPQHANVHVSLPPAPPQPRVLTEKEKMAAALFGGMGSGSSTSGAGSKRRSVTGSTSTSAVASPAVPANHAPAPAPSVPVPAAPVGGMDIFADMATVSSSSSVSTASQLHAPAPTSHANTLGMMDELLDMATTPAPAPALTPLTPTHSAAASMDIFSLQQPQSVPQQHTTPPSSGMMRSNQPAYQQPAQPQTSNNISDIFANIDLTGALSSGGLSATTPGHAIKPFVITTQDFGRRWGTTPIENKASVPVAQFPRLDLESLRRAMPPTYHHVESIPATQEAIFAATSTTVGAVILVHAKIQAARRTIDLLVKSTAADVGTQEHANLQLALSNFRG